MSPYRHSGNLVAGVLALSAVVLLANPARAEFSAIEAPLGAPTELAIELRGRVAARCELVTPPRPSGLALRAAGSAESEFKFDCNAPFTVKVRSANGGFASDGLLSARLPYELSIRLGTDAGQRDLGWCDSASLGAGGACAFGGSRGWSSGDDTAIDQDGRLRLRWREGAPLTGAYRDTITIELEVRS